MKRIALPVSYGTRTELLLCASCIVRIVAVPCRGLAKCLYYAALFFERLPESLARFALEVMEPTKQESI